MSPPALVPRKTTADTVELASVRVRRISLSVFASLMVGLTLDNGSVLAEVFRAGS